MRIYGYEIGGELIVQMLLDKLKLELKVDERGKPILDEIERSE